VPTHITSGAQSYRRQSPAGGAVVSDLYAETNASLSTKEPATVEVIDDRNGENTARLQVTTEQLRSERPSD
jgi:hypothetical protein